MTSLCTWYLEEIPYSSVVRHATLIAMVAASIPSRARFSPIAIVGAAGAMGRWFTQMFRETGAVVHEIDVDTPETLYQRLLKESQTVLFTVPISCTQSAIEDLLPYINASAIVCDLTSIKAVSFDTMLRHPGEVIGIHPMCAPSDRGLDGQVVVWCEGRAGYLSAELLEWFCGQKASVTKMTPERHDALMAVVQGLTHFQSIVFAHALGTLGISPEETMTVASPIYALRMQLMGRILAQNPQLYIDIERHNPYVPQALDALRASALKFQQAIVGGPESQCIEFFKEAADALGAFAPEARKVSDSLLAARNRT